MKRSLNGYRRGFTLLELVVTIALLGVLMALAAPAFTGWIRNAQVRTAADALQNAVRLAQAEAVRQNRPVVFFFTNDAPTLTAQAAADGRTWVARTIPAPGEASARFVDSGSLADNGGAVTVTGGPAVLCFNSAGRQAAFNAAANGVGLDCATPGNALVRYEITSPGAERRLQVTVSLAGQVRMCDADRAQSSSTPWGCPT